MDIKLGLVMSMRIVSRFLKMHPMPINTPFLRRYLIYQALDSVQRRYNNLLIIRFIIYAYNLKMHDDVCITIESISGREV